jgi:hypothetical protein
MLRILLGIMVAALCVTDDSCMGNPMPSGSPGDSQLIDGLWSGAWGGANRGDGVVFLPVRAELFVEGDHIELRGFRSVDKLTGKVRLDKSAKKMYITPSEKAGDQPPPKAIEFTYEIKADRLTLIDSDKFPITFQRHRVASNPLANVQLELVAATGINDAGDLIVTKFSVLRAGRTGATYFEPQQRSLKTKQATVLVVQENGWKKINVEEARRLIRESTPVVVTYRDDVRPSPYQLHELWKDMGPAGPDSDAVWRTFSRTLRPGTLVFILSATENQTMP